MNRTQQLTIGAILGVFSSLTCAANQLVEYSIKEALNTEDARLRLGDSVKFYFGEKPANLSGQTIIISKVRRKTVRDKENPCHWAFLSSLLKLKEEALERNSHFVVNIASNYKNNVILSKDTYQCSMGLVAVEVALKGELLEASAKLIDGHSGDERVISNPVDISNAVLTPEPVITPRTTQTPIQAPIQTQPQPRTDLGRSVGERLQVLKNLYEAGEIDQKTYETQRQRILDGI